MFEEALEAQEGRPAASRIDTELTADDWRSRGRATTRRSSRSALGKPFPQEPREQLWGAIGAVFASWMNHRAMIYRRLHDIPESWGTAVNVQAMVFGNMGEDCATGVAFTRNPSTGENRLYGEYPDQRPGRGRGRRHPHAAAADRRQGSWRRSPTHRRWRRRCRRSSGSSTRCVDQARGPLPRHAGHRVHGRAGQALHAADPQRQAHRQGGAEDRRRHGRARA